MTELADRIANDLMKDGLAVVGGDEPRKKLEAAEFTVGDLYDAIEAIGIAHPRDVTIRGGRWDGAVEIAL